MRLPVDQLHPAAPNTCTPTNRIGIATSATSSGPSRTTSSRSFVAAEGARRGSRTTGALRPGGARLFPSAQAGTAGHEPGRPAGQPRRRHQPDQTDHRTGRVTPGQPDERRSGQRPRRPCDPVVRGADRGSELRRRPQHPGSQHPQAGEREGREQAQSHPNPRRCAGGDEGDQRDLDGVGQRGGGDLHQHRDGRRQHQGGSAQIPDRGRRHQHRKQEQGPQRIRHRLGEGARRYQRRQRHGPGQQKLVLRRSRPHRLAARGLGRHARPRRAFRSPAQEPRPESQMALFRR